MKIISLAFILAVSMVSCNKKEEIKAGENPIKTKADASPESSEDTQHCFEFVQQKDTISLSYRQTENSISGQLRFKNFEKDSSHGPVSGLFSGDTLKLVYTFQSEGTESVREINFLKKGLSLQMGTGDMEDLNGKMVFKRPASVQYTDAIVLVKTDCNN